MKVASINVNFRLPDGFEGGLNEALEEIVKYRRGLGLVDVAPGTPSRLSEMEEHAANANWKKFLKGLEDGYKLIGSVNVSETKDWP